MDYNFRDIEQKWQKRWVENGTYRVVEDKNKKKFYVLNMFPYPSGAGLHVGHPLGYIASDIYARYKRLQGFNVLNPMGYDAYGLPAEQYAIQTGQHPEKTTFENIDRYRSQLDKIGLGIGLTSHIVIVFLIHYSDKIKSRKVFRRELTRSVIERVSMPFSTLSHTIIRQLSHMPGANACRINEELILKPPLSHQMPHDAISRW